MSKEREPLYICENCDKGTDAGYFDKETGQTLCHNCFNERQRSFKDQRIADLEAKLAESEKAYTDLKELEQATTESLYASREYLDELKSEKWALEQQLAEKEKEYQDAISNFVSLENARAILQLEKVKWIVEDIQYTNGNDDNISRDFLINEIDNQIKQLKEGK